MTGLGSMLGGLGGSTVGRAVVEIVGDSAKLKADFAAAKATTVGETNIMGQQVNRFGSLTKTAFGVAGLAAAAFAAKGVMSFIDFDDAMVQSLAIMGDVTDEQRAMMEDTARTIAKTTTFSATQAAEAYYGLASAGLDVEQSIAALPQVAAFAQAGMFDLATATDLALNSQSALGLKVDDSAQNLVNLTRVTDVLVEANNMATGTVESFAESLTNKSAGALRLVGKELEEGVAILAAYAEQGVQGKEAGEKLNIVLRDLQTAALKNGDEFARLGIKVFDASGEMRPFHAILGDLEVALDGMSDKERRATMMTLGFQDRSVAATATLLGMSDAIRQYEQRLLAAGGATQEVAENQLESLRAKLILAWHVIEDVAISLGETLAPMVGVFADAVRLVFTILGPFVKALGWLLSTLADISPILPVIAIGFTILAVSLGSVSLALAQVVVWAFSAGGAIMALNPIIAAVVVTVGAAIAIWSAWKTANEEHAKSVEASGNFLTAYAKNVELGIHSMDDWKEKVKQVTNDETLSAEEKAKLVAQADRLTVALDAGASAAADASQEQRALAAAHEEARDAARDQWAAELQLAGGFLSVQGAAFSAIDSAETYAAAQAKVARLARQGKQDTKAYTEAVRERNRAELSAIQGQAQLENAVVSYLKEQDGSKAAQREAIAQIKEWGENVGASDERVAGLIDRIKEHIRTINEIPGRTDTNVNANTGKAEDDIARTMRRLRELASFGKSIVLTTHYVSTGKPGGGDTPLLAAGGVIAGAQGFVTRGPTYLVGESGRSTFAGRGAEAVIPFDERGIGILSEAMSRALAKGGGGRPMHLTLEVDGKMLTRSVSLHEGENRLTLGRRDL